VLALHVYKQQRQLLHLEHRSTEVVLGADACHLRTKC